MKPKDSPSSEVAFSAASSKIHLNYAVCVDTVQAARQLIAEIEADTGMTPTSITDDCGNEVTI